MGFSLHFWVSVKFYPPNCRFPAPNFSLKPWMLRARKVSKSYFQEPTPQPFDGWAGSYFPRCSVKKKGVLPIWHVQKEFPSEGIDSWHVLSSCEKRLFRIRRRCKTNFWWSFFRRLSFCRQRTFSERITSDVFACGRYGDIYVYTYIVQHDTFTVR